MKNLKLTSSIVPLIFLFNLISAQTINVGGIDRTFVIHVPNNLPSGQDVPVVIALHSLGSTAAQFESYTGFSDKADHDNFIAVYPQGIGNSWNAGACCDPAVSEGSDDISFISALIDTLIEEYPVDSDQVFLTGFSNGAIMGYALAQVLSEKINGYAAVAGLLAMDVDPPSVSIPIMHIHALDDNAVNINGMWEYPSVFDLLDEWKTYNNITAEPDTFRNDSRITGILYPSDDSLANIILYLSETGGHQWNINSRLGTTNRIWEFFSTGINKTYTIYDTIIEGPRNRDFKIQIPSRFFTSLDENERYPLILAAHGWDQNAEIMEEITGFSVKSNYEHFFVVYLHYVGPPPDLSWNYFMEEDKPDDIGYCKAVIDTMFERFPIDSSKVFMVGFSDGCGMANRMAFETDGLIDAIGTVGGMVTFEPEVETNPVRMIHLHARNDPAVNYSNVRNNALNYWLLVNDCIDIPDTVCNDQSYIGEMWKNTENDTMIMFYTLPWNQHAWPVNNQTTMKISATDLIWDFLKNGIAIAEIPTMLIEDNKQNTQKALTIYPNPADDQIMLNFKLSEYDNLSLQILQLNGVEVISKELDGMPSGISHFQTNIEELPKGYYILRIVGSTTVQCCSFIKQ